MQEEHLLAGLYAKKRLPETVRADTSQPYETTSRTAEPLYTVCSGSGNRLFAPPRFVASASGSSSDAEARAAPAYFGVLIWTQQQNLRMLQTFRKRKILARKCVMLAKKCFVLDLDGTVYLGDVPIQGTLDFILRHWDRTDFHFLSNNTSKSPSSYVNKLNRLGIPATLEQILSPVTPLVAHLRAVGIRTVYPVGNRDFVACLRERMPELELLEPSSSACAEAVVLAYDTELTYEKLSHSALLLQRSEVAFLATHPDLVCPSPQGPLPDVGSFLALYETATGRRPEHIFGKPDPAVLEPLLARYNRKDMVMVGDRLSTDKRLAENAGIDFILVLSGEATRADLPGLERQPTCVVSDLGALEN